MKEKVLLAMSGGVDSSVAVHILQQQGFEVIGLTFVNYEKTNPGDYDFIEDARLVARRFGIKHFVIDIRKEFKEKIIDFFVNEYLRGRTPNPCVICNRIIKWKTFLEYADELEARYIATGHYAKIKFENGRYFIAKGIDEWKDQSYFLWNLPQEYLERTLFPLGDMTKENIKKLASELGLDPIADKKESYDVCFVRTDDYRDFLTNYTKEKNIKISEGNFVDQNGNILGRHKGLPFYTIGQRKGLGIALGHPAFVKKLNPADNTITVVKREHLAEKIVFAENLNYQKYEKIPDKLFTVRIRYKDKGAMAKVREENGMLKIDFIEEVFAVAPGQSAVVYEGEDIVAGGIIK